MHGASSNRICVHLVRHGPAKINFIILTVMNEPATLPVCATPALKPCPFCNGEADYVPWCQGHAPEYHWPHQVVHNCPVTGQQICIRAHPDTMEEVVKRWNSRPGSPPPQKYAVVLRIHVEPIVGGFIANTDRPYLVPEGQESRVRNTLSRMGTIGQVTVIIADKATLLANPFDLCEEDFNDPLPVPDEESMAADASLQAVLTEYLARHTGGPGDAEPIQTGHQP